MTTNARRQNKHTPYKLEVDGKEYGCYADAQRAIRIGAFAIQAGEAKNYTVRNLDDNVVDEG